MALYFVFREESDAEAFVSGTAGGLKLAAPSAVILRQVAADAPGAAVLSLPTGELSAALRTGVIDGVAVADLDTARSVAEVGTLYEYAPGDSALQELAPPTVSGTAGADEIAVGAGPQVVYARGGGDDVYTQGGDDTVYAGPGRDAVYGGSGNDALWGGRGADTLGGGADNDMLGGAAGDDTMFGAGGNDVFYASGGADRVYAGTGDDRVYAGRDDDRVFGAGGSDMLFGGAGDDTLGGGGNDDAIYGGAGDDTLYDGGAGDSALYGGAGDDALYAALGRETLSGGDGADSFHFTADAVTNVVTDFTSGEDMLDLRSFGLSGGRDGLVEQATEDGLMIGVARRTFLELDGVERLDDGDFLF